jgi:hypothetical protein
MTEPPDDWIVSCVCESFHCPPSVAEQELERNPDLVLSILHMRAYRDTKLAIDRAQKEDQVPKTPMVDVVMAIEVELMQERNQERNED